MIYETDNKGSFATGKLIWGILFFGTLIGLNETLIGSLQIPYRSVVLGAITISLLSFARYHNPKPGTSILIIIIALLFKINSTGIHACTMSAMLCGPMALLLLGTGYELSASLIIRRNDARIYMNVALCCMLTAVIMSACFALFQVYVVKDPNWIGKRFTDYMFLKGPLIAAVSSPVSVTGIWIFKHLNPAFANVFLKRSLITQLILGLFIAGLWVVGYIAVQ